MRGNELEKTKEEAKNTITILKDNMEDIIATASVAYAINNGGKSYDEFMESFLDTYVKMTKSYEKCLLSRIQKMQKVFDEYSELDEEIQSLGIK